MHSPIFKEFLLNLKQDNEKLKMETKAYRDD